RRGDRGDGSVEEKTIVKATLLSEQSGLRTWAVIGETGDEAMNVLTTFAADHGLAAAHFVAIGAFSAATVAFFDWSTKTYRHIRIDEQVEVLSCAGDVTV